MDNQELLFLSNNSFIKNERFIRLNGRPFYEIRIKDKELSGVSIHRIIKYVNYYLKKYAAIKLPVLLHFEDEVVIKDKLTYVVLECICYYLINNRNIEVHICWNPKRHIITEGVYSSPLLLLAEGSKGNVIKFKKKFLSDGFRRHFRKVVEKSNANLCASFQEVDTFFKMFDSCDMVKEEIIEAVAELVGNAFEHGGSDCLIDIDVTDRYKTDDRENGKEVYSVNIVVLNFSKKLIGDELKERVSNGEMTGNRNKQLMDVLDYHKTNFFDEKYTEEDFFNISVFQDRISGVDKGNSGGKGLTLLIKSLQQRSYENHCYMLSGNRTVFFDKDYLGYNDDNWIGFNKENDFYKRKPDDSVFAECETFFPGTAYNLDFILMKG